MKFQPNSFNSVQLTERTQNCTYLCYKGNNLSGHDFVTDRQADARGKKITTTLAGGDILFWVQKSEENMH